MQETDAAGDTRACNSLATVVCLQVNNINVMVLSSSKSSIEEYGDPAKFLEDNQYLLGKQVFLGKLPSTCNHKPAGRLLHACSRGAPAQCTGCVQSSLMQPLQVPWRSSEEESNRVRDTNALQVRPGRRVDLPPTRCQWPVCWTCRPPRTKRANRELLLASRYPPVYACSTAVLLVTQTCLLQSALPCKI